MRTEAQVAQGHFRTFQLILDKLEKMSGDWEDLNEFWKYEIAELRETVAQKRDELKEEMELDK